MGTTDILEKTNLRVRVTGGLDDADREHLTTGQIEEIERLDRRMSTWLERDPDHQRQFLKAPTVAIAAATGELPSTDAEELVEGSGQDAGEVLRMADLASFEDQPPAPVATFGLKETTAQNDVTFMLSLGALTKAFKAATAGPLDAAMPSGRLRAPLPVPDLDVAFSILAEPLVGPVLAFVDDTVHLAIEFRTQLEIEAHGIELPPENVLVTVPLLVESGTAPKLRLAILPDADGAQFGTVLETERDPEIAGLDVSTIEQVARGTVELLPDLGATVDETFPTEVKNLLANHLDTVRDAVASWFAAELLHERLDGNPLLALVTEIPQRQILCDRDGPTDLRAGFVRGDDETGHEDGLAIGLGYLDDAELPEDSLIGHGWSSWVEVGNRLILELVCCRVPDTFPGLGADSARHTSNSCRWDDGTFRDRSSNEWDLDFLEVSCGDGLTLDLRAARSGRGYTATVTVHFVLGATTPDEKGLSILDVGYDIDVDVELKWWARLGLALAGVLIGLLGGGAWWVLGGALAVGVPLAIEAILSFSLSKAIPSELENVPDLVRVIPPELTELLGSPIAHDSLWDDLEMSGEISELPTPREQTELPQFIGQPKKAAIEELEALGLRFEIDERADEQTRGTVIDQRPAAGTPVHSRAIVSLDVSTGPKGPQKPVPDVRGLADLAARDVLRDVGFRNVEPSDEPVPGPPPVMHVVDQRPSPGSRISLTSPVTLFLSDGSGQKHGGGDGEGGRHPL